MPVLTLRGLLPNPASSTDVLHWELPENSNLNTQIGPTTSVDGAAICINDQDVPNFHANTFTVTIDAGNVGARFGYAQGTDLVDAASTVVCNSWVRINVAVVNDQAIGLLNFENTALNNAYGSSTEIII